ncbi:hypothetical protein BRD15_08025 [Halobacteriales archaeon SW_6_65_15]|jgi:hypothetical protein|nr:MAG: hypothetical protein BRD15_08025 [Halobacteriales archaeon SW_6_65_15]
MAIIELNLEKPALKRVESVEEQRTRSDRTETGISGETAGASELSSTETTSGEMTSSGTGSSELVSDETASGDLSSETTTSEQSGGKSRVRKYGRRMALLGGTAAGVAAARKLRQRRKSGSEQQDLEEDWQTAE